eukprot:Gb_16366 [translate_table: standard]
MRLFVRLMHESSKVPLPIRISNVFKLGQEPKGGTCVSTLCREGRLTEALDILQHMEYPDIWVKLDTFAFILQACANMKALAEGKQIHARMHKTGIDQNIFLGNKLVIMYAKCGSLDYARQMFDKMSERNVVSWTAMIGGYVKHGLCEEALSLFYEMKKVRTQPDNFIFPGVLKACAALADLQQGKEVHDYITKSGIEPDVFVGNSLVEMYAKCGSIEDARLVFDKLSKKNVVSWNVMISGYAQNGHGEKALHLFHEMQLGGMSPNPVTITSTLPACASLAALQQGKEIHGKIIKNALNSDILVGNALLDMYAKCGSTENAWRVFVKMFQKDLGSWNSMIACYAKNGYRDEALELFQQMQSVGIKGNVVSWTAIIATYAQCGKGEEALKLFHQMQLVGIKPDIISWNAVITCFAQNGYGNEALKSFRQMQLSGMKPNFVTISSVLPACASLAALQQGKEIHGCIISSGFKSDVFVGSALVDMYAKCGCIEYAWKVFNKTSQKNIVSWNAMIAGCAMHGRGQDALSLFRQMQQADMKPDSITFTGVLSACSHAGLVDEGWQYFDSMKRDHLITPNEEHYACMVDLLGRSGCLDEARDLINTIPLEPNACVWGALLGACGIHCNIELGEYVAERLFVLEPENAGNYVLMSNVYAAAGRWDDVVKVRKIMKDKGLKKIPGCSLIEVKNKMHRFFVGDRSHPQADRIYAMLESLAGQMEEAGYVPDTNFVLHDMDEEGKLKIVCSHSQKQAIAFSLTNTYPKTLPDHQKLSCVS